MDVLVTGAAGTVGSAVRDHLDDHPDHAFTYLDAVDGEGVDVVADLRDGAAARAALEGRDAAVHLALNTDLNVSVTEVDWGPALADNLRMATAVFGAAVDCGLEAVAFASTNHVVGGYETEHAPAIYGGDPPVTVGPEAPPRPDSLYAVEKLYEEGLGRFCADHHGLRCYALRFGGVLPAAHDHPRGAAERAVAAGAYERGSEEYERTVAHFRALWCSRRDAAGLVERCLADRDVGFGAFYGVSDNADCWFDRSNARDLLGFEPRDSADDRS